MRFKRRETQEKQSTSAELKDLDNGWDWDPARNCKLNLNQVDIVGEELKSFNDSERNLNLEQGMQNPTSDYVKYKNSTSGCVELTIKIEIKLNQN